MIDHAQLCQFRKSLSSVQQVNLLVYILHHLNRSGLLGDNILHGIDSTELANDHNSVFIIVFLIFMVLFRKTPHTET